MTELPKEVEEQRSKDISPAMLEKARAPKKTWFFERMGDGMILACEYKEAWQICYNRSRWKRRDFRLLGTSDGTTFARMVRDSFKEAQRLDPIVQKKREELRRYMDREEQLVIDEAVDMEGDPEDEFNEVQKQKVLRLRKIIDRLHDELDVLEKEYQDKVSHVVKRATDAELEVAKKNQAARLASDPDNFDWPDENGNINTPDASAKGRNKIVTLIEQRVE